MTPPSGPSESSADNAGTGKNLTVYGRQGSPSVTVALPFSKIQVNEDAEAMAALGQVVDLVRRLAEAAAEPRNAGRAELDAVGREAAALLEQLHG